MRHSFFTVIACLAVVSPTLAAETEIRSTVDQVIVYPDGATVTRIIRANLAAGDVTLIARDFPPSLDPSSLRVEGEGAVRFAIGSIDARPPRAERPPANPALEKQIESLRDERGALDGKIAAAAARRKFAERFAEHTPTGLGDKGEARPLAEWRAAFAAVAEEIAGADSAIREAKLAQREIDRSLARLEAERVANPPRKMEVRIDLAAEAATSATLRISYTVRDAGWAPNYDARLDTGARDRKPSLQLIRRAEIVQRTGEDWSDVMLSVSTMRTAKGGNAPELRPLLVRYPEPVRSRADSGGNRTAGLTASAPLAPGSAPRDALSEMKQEAAEERESILDAGGYQAVFRIPARVSVATNEGAKSFRIGSATVAPELVVRAAPALDSAAYLEATFKQAEDAPLLPGRVTIFRDGVYVGRGTMPLPPKDEVARVGFGVDEKVKVARVTTRKIEASTGFFTSSKVDEREYKITLRNGHDAPVRVMIEDQVPVSEIADVQVELLPVTTPVSARDVRDRRGVLAWNFEAAAGEVRDLKLGWRIRWPADKTIVYDAPRS